MQGSRKPKPKPIGGRKPLAGAPATGGQAGTRKPGKKPLKDRPFKPQPVGGMGGSTRPRPRPGGPKPKPIKRGK